MDHEQAQTLASDALDGAASTEQERDLALHLVGCPDCKERYEALQRSRAAFRQVGSARPATEAVEAAVHRSTTVLRGEADPGTATEPRLWTEDDTGPIHTIPEPGHFEPPHSEPSPIEPPPYETPPTPDASDEPDTLHETVPNLDDDAPPLHSTAVEPTVADEAAAAEPWDRSGAEPPAWSVPAASSEPDEADEPDEIPASGSGPTVDVIEVPIDAPPSPADTGPMASPYTPEPLEHPREPSEERDERRRPTGPWVIGIAAAVALAVVAGFLVTRGPDVLESSASLPSADEVRAGVTGVFDDLQSIKASYAVTRLSLWRLRQEGEKLVYSFSNGTVSGRFLMEDEPSRFREERSLEVQGDELSRSTIVSTSEERRTLETLDGEARLIIEADPAFGPPSSDLAPRLGILEQAVTSAARLLVDASDLEVIEATTYERADVIRVRFSVAPSEYTRADRIEILLDAQTMFPLQVRRSISRSEAQILGPAELLGPDAIEAAFGERQRITTELVELRSVVLDDVILNGEFMLEVPEGATEEAADAGFTRLSKAEVRDDLGFDPLLPAALPAGFREEAFAVHTGEKRPWGPNDAFPAPDGILQATYSDGKTTIVVAERRQPDGAFEVNESPLKSGGLPVVERSVVRGGRRLTYAISPELPPHVYGWVDDVFILVSGWAPPDDLIRVAASLAPEAPGAPAADQPAPDGETEVVVPGEDE